MSKKTKIIRGGESAVYTELGALPAGTPIRVLIPGLDWIDTFVGVARGYDNLRTATIAGQSVIISDKPITRNWQVEIPLPPVVPEDGVYAYDQPGEPSPFGTVYKYRKGDWRDSGGYPVANPGHLQNEYEAGRLKKLRF